MWSHHFTAVKSSLNFLNAPINFNRMSVLPWIRRDTKQDWAARNPFPESNDVEPPAPPWGRLKLPNSIANIWDNFGMRTVCTLSISLLEEGFLPVYTNYCWSKVPQIFVRHWNVSINDTSSPWRLSWNIAFIVPPEKKKNSLKGNHSKSLKTTVVFYFQILVLSVWSWKLQSFFFFFFS